MKSDRETTRSQLTWIFRYHCVSSYIRRHWVTFDLLSLFRTHLEYCFKHLFWPFHALSDYTFPCPLQSQSFIQWMWNSHFFLIQMGRAKWTLSKAMLLVWMKSVEALIFLLKYYIHSLLLHHFRADSYLQLHFSKPLQAWLVC